MKQKSSSSQVVTKAYLDQALDGRFGMYDKKMDGRFKMIDDKFKLSEINTDIKLENLERKIDEKAQRYRDQVLTSNDRLAKTLETMREEIEIGFYHVNKRLDDHDKQIKILKSS